MANQAKQETLSAESLAQESVFSDLISREFKPKTEQAREAVESAVRTLAEQALVNTVTLSEDSYYTIGALIGEIDKKLSEQINLILHHPEFQALESAWRGLHYLVSNSETDSKLKIRFLNVSKDEMRKNLKRYKGVAWDQSPFFKAVYEAEYGQLGGEPYGAKTNPVDEFAFEENIDGANHSKYSWANAAYAMAVNINRSYKLYGWGTSIRGVESGGIVENLPVHTFPTDDGGVDAKCPTEVAISDRREAELSNSGFLPLVHRKNTDYAAFIGAQSLQKPVEYDDPDATANAALAARLPYLFACSRFAHYLKCIVRDKVGSFKEREEMERWLNDWIMDYVDGDPINSTTEVKARRPLSDAQVVVEDIEGQPGYYSAKFYLRPHFQLEGLTVSLRLVTKLPANEASS